MKVFYLNTFLKSFRDLQPEEKDKVRKSVASVLKVLEEKTPLSAGLGLKKIKRTHWEIRITLKLRILFSLSSETVMFSLVGNHNDVKNFLRNIR